MLVVCPLQSIIIDYLIAEARRMRMQPLRLPIFQMGSQGRPNLSFCLVFGSAEKKYEHLLAHATN